MILYSEYSGFTAQAALSTVAVTATVAASGRLGCHVTYAAFSAGEAQAQLPRFHDCLSLRVVTDSSHVVNDVQVPTDVLAWSQIPWIEARLDSFLAKAFTGTSSTKQDFPQSTGSGYHYILFYG